MDSKDWYDCGAKIGDLVQKAVDQKNFSSLSDAIMETIGDTVDAAVSSVQPSGKKSRSGHRSSGTYRSSGRAYQNAKANANISDLFDRDDTRSGKRNADETGGVRRSSRGIFSMVAGYGMAIVSGVTMLAFFLLAALFGIGAFRIGAFFFMILTAVFAIVGARGGGYRSRMRQLERYLKIMDGRDVVTVQELASGSGKSVKEVQKDLKAMIADGMFASEAYLDPQGTNLMTSRKAYRQYQETMKAYEQRKAELDKQRKAAGKTESQGVQLTEPQRRAAEKDLAAYSDETRKILQEGREFIAHIHECNEQIPDEEMTRKLAVLEQVVARIFDQVAKKPDSAPDLHRMMSYYLPVTRKLVDAYVELQDVGEAGENVTKTRREIERSLDTINLAFETFLDSFYQDTAWDISSDISAMETMMARDGLTQGGDFARTRKVGSDVGGTAADTAGQTPSGSSAAGTASGGTAGDSGAGSAAAGAAGTAAAGGAAGAVAAGGGAAAAGAGGAAAAVMKEEQ